LERESGVLQESNLFPTKWQVFVATTLVAIRRPRYNGVRII